MTQTYSPDTVADFFIATAQESGSYISNLKLQKLVYYAQAWHLAIHDARLMNTDFEAWVHGPVCNELYQRFKPYGFNPISEKVSIPVFPPETQNFLNKICEVFMPFDAYELELMTHREAPWLIARGDLAQDIPCRTIISDEDMKAYYRRLGESTDDED